MDNWASHPSLTFADAMVDFQGDLYSIQVSGTGSIWKYDLTRYLGTIIRQLHAGIIDLARSFLDGSKIWVVNGKVSGTSHYLSEYGILL